MKKDIKVIFLITIFTILLFGNTVFASGDDGDPQEGRAMGYTAEEQDDGGDSGIMLFSTKTLTSVSPFTESTYTHSSVYEDTNIRNGIDVSSWNGDINWDKVAADGVEFVMIRAGYRTYGSGVIYADSNFETNIKGALDAGLKVGVYIFSQAITKTEALEEAEFILNKISGYDVTLPIVFDFEYASSSSGNTGRLYNANLSVSQATEICKKFAAAVEAEGYRAMIYANQSMLTNGVDADTLALNYAVWLANYTTKTSYLGDYDMWQYSSSGSVSGISGNVDCNFWYDDGTLEREKVPSTKISLNVTSKSLMVGKAFTLKATLSPSSTTDNISFSSSKPYVAYVNAAGYVKAVSKGVTTITVTTTSGLTKKCKVIVNEDLSNYEITSISNQEYTGSAIKPTVTVQRTKKIATSAKTTANLSMRSGPSTSYGKITTIPKGTKVTVLGSITVDDMVWYAVSAKVSGTTYKGYCSSSYLTVTKTYKTLTKNTHYTVKYTNNKKVGKATVTVTGIDGGTASGTLKKTFKICPKKITSIKTVSVSKTAAKIKWSKKTSGSGYQIYRKKGSSGTYKLIKTIKKNTTVTYKNTGLAKNTTYYYKVRTYKVVDGKYYYGAFSKALKVTTKK